MTPQVLVYGYGRRDSPRLQAALSAAIQLSAAVTPDVAEATVREVRGMYLRGAAMLTVEIDSYAAYHAVIDVCWRWLPLQIPDMFPVLRLMCVFANGPCRCLFTGHSSGARLGEGLARLCRARRVAAAVCCLTRRSGA